MGSKLVAIPKIDVNKNNMKILKLTVHKKAFEVMVTGEKKDEYRDASQWILSRLMDKKGKPKLYDLVQFTNGYGADRPSFTCESKGWEVILGRETLKWSNGLSVETYLGMIKIKLGEIISKNNC